MYIKTIGKKTPLFTLVVNAMKIDLLIHVTHNSALFCLMFFLQLFGT